MCMTNTRYRVHTVYLTYMYMNKKFICFLPCYCTPYFQIQVGFMYGSMVRQQCLCALPVFMSQDKQNLSFHFFCIALHFPLLSAPSLRFSLIYVNEDPCTSYIHSIQSRYFCNSLINQPTPFHNLRRIPFSKKWENNFGSRYTP